MGWKNWPYWLRGGIIFSIIYLIIFIILKLIPCDSTGYLGGSCLGLGILTLVLLSPASGILNLLNLDNSNLISVFLLALICYFIIGALIVSVINKFKNLKNGKNK